MPSADYTILYLEDPFCTIKTDNCKICRCTTVVRLEKGKLHIDEKNFISLVVILKEMLMKRLIVSYYKDQKVFELNFLWAYFRI